MSIKRIAVKEKRHHIKLNGKQVNFMWFDNDKVGVSALVSIMVLFFLGVGVVVFTLFAQ